MIRIGTAGWSYDDWKGVCDNCAGKHAPGLLAMLNTQEAQKAYWEAEQAKVEQRHRKVGDTLSSLQDELTGLQERIASTQARIDTLRSTDE